MPEGFLGKAILFVIILLVIILIIVGASGKLKGLGSSIFSFGP